MLTRFTRLGVAISLALGFVCVATLKYDPYRSLSLGRARQDDRRRANISITPTSIRCDVPLCIVAHGIDVLVLEKYLAQHPTVPALVLHYSTGTAPTVQAHNIGAETERIERHQFVIGAAADGARGTIFPPLYRSLLARRSPLSAESAWDAGRGRKKTRRGKEEGAARLRASQLVALSLGGGAAGAARAR